MNESESVQAKGTVSPDTNMEERLIKSLTIAW
jgi:hypothetical protein